jgi:hypothetical protein
MSNDGTGSSTLGTLNVVITTILAIVAGWSGFQLNHADNRLKDLEAQVKTTEEQRAERESGEKKQMMVYEAVVNSLESNNSKRQSVAKALVTSMLELDNPLRSGLLAALADSGTPEVREEVRSIVSKENRFRQEQYQPSVSKAGKLFDWRDIDYDVFWCEKSGPTAQRIADSIKQELLSEGAKGRIRSRLLPDSVNARPGYQHAGFVIRYNQGEEKEALELARVGNKVLSQDGIFQPSVSHQQTAWYLSAFVCP